MAPHPSLLPGCPLPESSSGTCRGLTMDAAGNLYGSAFTGCAFGHGCIFKLTYSGGVRNEPSLHDFTGGTDGGRTWWRAAGGARKSLTAEVVGFRVVA